MDTVSRKQLTVAIDLRSLIGPRTGTMVGVKTGVGEYAEQLVKALYREGNFRLVLYSNRMRTAPSYGEDIRGEQVHTRYPNRFLDLIAKGCNRPYYDDIVARSTGHPVDIWLSPHVMSAPVRKAKKVVVVHDCSFLYPNFFSLRKRYWHWSMGIARTLARTDLIIAVSANTRQELLRHYPLDPQRVIVICPGIDERFFDVVPPATLDAVRVFYHLPSRFILFLGTIEPRKNILTLLRAFTYVASHTDTHLVLAGEMGWVYGPVMRALEAHPYATRIHRLGYIPQAHKHALYRLSSCFLYPSLYEGFGFPPLEAIACGIPTVVSHTTSLPEVVGTQAIAVDPYDVEDIVRAIRYALENNSYRARCISEGPHHARKFIWHVAAARIVDEIHRMT